MKDDWNPTRAIISRIECRFIIEYIIITNSISGGSHNKVLLKKVYNSLNYEVWFGSYNSLLPPWTYTRMRRCAIAAKILNITFSMAHTFAFSSYREITPSFQFLRWPPIKLQKTDYKTVRIQNAHFWLLCNLLNPYNYRIFSQNSRTKLLTTISSGFISIGYLRHPLLSFCNIWKWCNAKSTPQK